MSDDFYDYVRGKTDKLPAGHDLAGMRVYRHLVYLGASQMIEAQFPGLKNDLGDAAWRVLIEGFVRESTWTSPYYGDLPDEFMAYVQRTSGAENLQ